MLRSIGLFLALAILWLLLSGYFDKPLLLFFGVVSCIFTVWITHRMDMVDTETVPFELSGGIAGYWSWLFGEIAKANIAVTRAVLSDMSMVRPQMFSYSSEDTSPMGVVILANSITLTPGTVTVEVGEDGLMIHALTKEAADLAGIREMDRRVQALGKK